MKQLLIGFSALFVLILVGCAPSSSPSPKNNLDTASIVELKKGCDLNDADKCDKLGTIYTLDKLVKQDQSKALKYFTKACNLNNYNSCNSVGVLLIGWKKKREMSKAIKYLTKSCNGNFGAGCYNLAYTYLPGGISGTDYLKAKKYFSKACKLKDNQGCIEFKKLKRKGY